MNVNKWFFKYFVYYPVVILRGEWVYPHLRLFRVSQFWGRRKIANLQLNKLRKLVEDAKKNVPFYKDMLPTKIATLDDLKQIPLLTKDHVRNNYQQLQSAKLSFRKSVKTTGGSTGAPVTINKSCRSMAQELAAAWRGYEWAGLDIGDKQARFWGVPAGKSSYLRSRLVDMVTNRFRLSAFSFHEKDFENYVKELEKFKPRYFYGYVSMLKQFADFLIKNRESTNLQVDTVITTSEVLTDLDRNIIEQAFGAKVYNEYGCGEIGTIAHECQHGNMHINSENMIVEILDETGHSVEDGVVGEIVVTELNNKIMPLIRYQMKDFGSLSKEKCPCGRSLPILKEVQGRAYDILYNSSGDAFHGEFFLYMFEDLKKEGVIINGFQIVQPSEKQLEIRLIALGQHLKDATCYLTKRIQDTFQRDVDIKFLVVDSIERERSGKLRVVKRTFI